MRVPKATAKLTEKAFMAQVVQYARLNGWLVFHPYDSRRSVPGFPDLLMLRPADSRQVVAELKVGDNPVTRAQRTWVHAFLSANVPTFVWRETDWDQIERVLGAPAGGGRG